MLIHYNSPGKLNHHSNILTWAKKKNDKISAILHFLSCSKALTAISLALTKEARNFLFLSVAFVAFSWAIFAIWVASAVVWVAAFPFHLQVAAYSIAYPTFVASNGQLHSHAYKWDYQSIARKGTWDQPVHKLNWTYHIPNSLESTRLSKNYTYLILATTHKPSTKIIHCQTCSQHISLICTHIPTWT